MKRILFYSSLLLYSSFAFAQQVNTDSLQKAVNAAKEDTNKVNSYNDLSWYTKNGGNFNKADSFGRLALNLAEKLNYKKGIGDACMSIGNVYDNRGDNASALEYYNKALLIRKTIGDVYGQASALNNIGNVYDGQDNYSRALEYYLQGLAVAEHSGDKGHMAMLYGNIGNVYSLTREYDKALVFFSKGIHLQDSVQDLIGVATSYINIASIYYEQKDYDKCIESYLRSLNMAEKLGNKKIIVSATNEIGNAYYNKGDLKNALKYSTEALKIADSIGYNGGIAAASIDIGRTYSKLKDYKQALVYTNRGLLVSKSINSLTDIKEAELLLSKIYELLKDGLKSLEHYKIYINLSDSIFSKENTKKIVQSEMNFEFEKKQATQKAEQDKKDLVEREQEHKQQLIIYFISGILLLVFGFAIFAYRNYLQKQRANRELDIKNRKIESAYKIIEDKNREITDSINYAKLIQSAMLPSKEQIQKTFPESFVLFKPKAIVSGDFYFLASFPSKGGIEEHFSDNNTNLLSIPPLEGGEATIILAVADCTGHGVPGAFMSMIGNEKLNDAVEQSRNTGEILKLLNKGIKTSLRQSNESNSTRDGMDISLAAIGFSLPSKGGCSLQWSGANRPLWIVRKGKTEIEEIKPTKIAIGGFTDDNESFEVHNVNLNKGDTFYLFSDGYADQFGGPEGKKLTTKKFRELMLFLQNKTMPEQEKELNTYIENWKGSKEQLDDILIIGVRV
jgi:serine phosphatase RsbU (regulator of sigma subunit)